MIRVKYVIVVLITVNPAKLLIAAPSAVVIIHCLTEAAFLVPIHLEMAV
jgi:hypothetical protein